MKHIKSFLQFSLLAIVILGIFWAFSWKNPQADSDVLKIEFLNVGQGDAEYIRTPSGQDILIDGGPDNSVLNQLGEVMSSSDREIDLVILSHPHADHLAGLVEVLRRYKVDEVWETGIAYPNALYDQFEKEISNQKISEKKIKQGDEKKFGEIKISVLYPLSSLDQKTIDNLNNSSAVIRLDYKNFSVLFPGDLEKDAQKNILAENIHTTILKESHHGSFNGAGEDFLRIIRPAIAVIEVGKKNSYGHPQASTLNLLKSLAIKYYRTDQDGRVEILSNGVNYSVNTFSN